MGKGCAVDWVRVMVLGLLVGRAAWADAPVVPRAADAPELSGQAKRKVVGLSSALTAHLGTPRYERVLGGDGGG